ncbi:MAG: Ig-like domain-containing protein [Bacteroidota bacterium]
MKIINYLFVLSVMFVAGTSFGQGKLSIKVEPSSLNMNVGDNVQLKAKVQDGNGKEVTGKELAYYSTNARSVEVDSDGMVKAHQPGEYRLIIISPGDGDDFARADLKVSVNYPPIGKVEIAEVPNKIYAGTTFPLSITVKDKMGLVREDLEVSISSSSENVAKAVPSAPQVPVTP